MKLKQGFTLVELLIYVVIFAIAAGLLTSVLTIVLKVGSRESALTETTGQLNFVMQTISRLTRESSAIIVNATSTDVSNDGQVGSPYSRLVLRVKDSSGGVSDRDPIVIWNNNGIIEMSEGSGVNQRVSNLTDEQVIVDKLEFTKFTQYPGHDSVAIDIQLTYNSQNPESRITRSLRSAIARVSAATFDSNLLPGVNTYTIGQIGSGWGRIFMSDDSAANPAYTFISNTGMGLFRAASNILGFSTNGLERMRIDSSGNVGIGISTPNQKLDVAGTILGNILRIDSDRADVNRYFIISSYGSDGVIRINPSPSSTIYVNREVGLARDFHIWSGTTIPIFSAIGSTNNVGIGITTPGQKLSVAGTIESTSGGFKFPDGSTQIAAAGASLWTQSGSDIYNANSGNVGIGVTSPTAKLEVACPTGSTNIKAGTNQLGCMQTAEQGSATWWTANNTCFTAYGGKLPSAAEWYIAMNNYTLTNETNNWEWIDDFEEGLADSVMIVGSGNITAINDDAPSASYAYRCWLPR